MSHIRVESVVQMTVGVDDASILLSALQAVTEGEVYPLVVNKLTDRQFSLLVSLKDDLGQRMPAK